MRFVIFADIILLLSESPCKINKVLSHPTLPISITAQEDRHIQFFDNNTGEPAPRRGEVAVMSSG